MNMMNEMVNGGREILCCCSSPGCVAVACARHWWFFQCLRPCACLGPHEPPSLTQNPWASEQTKRRASLPNIFGMPPHRGQFVAKRQATLPNTSSMTSSHGQPVFERLLDLLQSNDGVQFRVLEHEPAYTSEESARIRGTPLSSGAKAIIVNADRGNFAMFVIPADRRFASKAVKKQIGIRNLRFATKEEMHEVTGLSPGSIPPFGSLFGMIQNVYCDEKLAEEGTINFNAGEHSISISMTFDDYLLIERPKLGHYSQEI